MCVIDTLFKAIITALDEGLNCSPLSRVGSGDNNC